MSDNFRIQEQLIQLVQEKPHIYDRSNPGYKDTIRKNNAFTEIGNSLNLSGKEAKTLWDNLKKQYTNYLKKLKNPSGSGLTNPPYFRHSASMNFYQAVYKPYKTNSNIDLEEDEPDDENGNSSHDNSTNETDHSMDAENSIIEDGTGIESNLQVEYTGFPDGHPVPGIVLHQQKVQPIPKVAKSRNGRKRQANQDEFDERFFAAIEKNSAIQTDQYDSFGANIATRLRAFSEKYPREGLTLQLQIQTLLTNFEIAALDNPQQAPEQQGQQASYTPSVP